MSIKRKYILFIVAVVLSIFCIKSYFNIRSNKVFAQQVTFSSLADFVQSYKTNQKFTIDFEHILNELDLFIALQAKHMSDDHLWLRNQIPAQHWFSLDAFTLSDDYKLSNQFFPYVEKRVLPKDSVIAVWGDLHGSVSTVVESLLQLQKDGYFDDQFVITRENFYGVFLGDFVDKEMHGTELLYLIMKLHNQNPGRIFMLRGNHEDAAVNKTFRKELGQKYSGLDQAVLKKIFCLYDHLPVAFFAGVPNGQGTINGIQFCHAGFEHSYCAENFLQSNAQFELITSLNRLGVLADLPGGQTKEQLKNLQNLVQAACSHTDASLEQKLIQEAKMEQRVINGHNWFVVALLTWLHKQEIINALPTLFQDITVQPSMNLGDIRLGFSWNSFTDQENNKRLGGRDDLHVLWSYAHFNMGPQATDYFLQLNSSEQWKLQTVIRGHQHQGKMLEDLQVGKGVARWFEGKLVTTVASPLLTGYSSFLMFHAAQDKTDWYIQRYAAKQGKIFEKKRLNLFEES